MLLFCACSGDETLSAGTGGTGGTAGGDGVGGAGGCSDTPAFEEFAWRADEPDARTERL